MLPATTPLQSAPDASSHYTQEDLDRLALALADAEKERIAVRLHDTVCQSLSAVQFLAGLTARQLTRDGAMPGEQLREIVQQLDHATSELQDLMAELRPGGLDHVDRLPAALAEIAQRFARSAPCEFRCPATLPVRDLATGNQLCRIFFSALGYVQLRAPSRIDAEITSSPREFALQVLCDGGKLAPKFVHEEGRLRDLLDRRIRLLGGTTHYCHESSGRFRFEARIPVQ